MKKSLRYSMVAALLSVSFSGFAADNHAAHWSYHGKTGPAHWADGVKWQVLQEPVELSFAQLRSFRKLYKMNTRPVQPANDRKVQVSM